MTVHEAPLDPIVQCHLVCEAWIAAIAEYDNAAVVDWTRAGLDRVTEAIPGAPTSVIVNGEDSTVGHQIGRSSR